MNFKKLCITCFCAFFIIGCSSKGNVIDLESASKLDSDLTVTDFILDGQLYKLPCAVTEFTKHGWNIKEENDETADNIQLEKNTHIELQMNNENYTNNYLIVDVYNDSEQPSALLGADALIHSIKVDYSDAETYVPIVTKGGVSEKTEVEKVNEVILGLNKQLYPDEKDDYFTDGVLTNEDFKNLLSISFDSDMLYSITIGDSNRKTDYLEYESPTKVKENISRTKQEIDKDSIEYNKNYKKILDKVTAQEIGSSASIHAEFTIVEEVFVGKSYGNTTSSLPTGSAYLIRDDDGNVYALTKSDDSKDYIAWPDLTIGQKIDVWALSYEVLHMDENDKDIVPLLNAKIIETNGEMIYRSYN